MKKLNNTELKILANRIHNKLIEQADIAQKESDEIADKANIKEAELALKQLKKLSPIARRMIRLRGSCDNVDTLTVQDILIKMRPVQNKIKIPSRYHDQSIFDELVISQINSPDIESLCNSVAEQYVNKTPTP